MSNEIQRAIVWVALLITHCSLLSASAQAAPITAASCSQSDVLAALGSVNAASAVVNIPAGNCTWTSNIHYTIPSNNTSLVIQGAGAVSATTGGASTTGTDLTAITVQLSNDQPGLAVGIAAGQSLRITGIAFILGAGDVVAHGLLQIGGTSNSVRIDHCHFQANGGAELQGVEFDGALLGVADHDFFDATNPVSNDLRFFNGSTWNGDSGGIGSGSWADTDHWGSSQFFFAEDDLFTGGAGDCVLGGRYVIRHSTLNGQMYNHGANDTTRGCRAAEFYLNTWTNTNVNLSGGAVESVNSGSMLVWGNNISGIRWVTVLAIVRQSNGTYTENAPPNGWGYCGNAQTGVTSPWDQNTTSNGYACLDAPGRGAGDLLTGSVWPNILNSVTGTQTWPHQALEPVYVWGNTYSDGGFGYSAEGMLNDQTNGNLADNRDYYQQFGANAEAGSFDGTKGVGQGLLSARPTSCTPNVAYWATDTNTLYQCSAANFWATYYQPYTYPHPLTTIVSAPPINAASCNANDVQVALSSVTSATTIVTIPAGTCHWSTQVSFTVPSGNTHLSILGAGSLNTLGGGDATVIVDDYASSNQLFVINTAGTSSLLRLAGITFQGGNDGGTANTKWNGLATISGNSQNVRVDHTHFNTTTYTVPQNSDDLVFYGAVLGVTDHNIFDGGQVRAYQGNLFGDSSGEGYGSWANDTALGTGGFMFFEDNTFNSAAGDDCTYGGRFVMRYNTFNNSAVQTHPTGGAGANARGCRAWEIYHNTFTASNSNPIFNVYFLSAGTGVMWGNSALTGYENFISIHSMRRDNSTYPEGPTPGGWGYCGTSFNGTGSAWDQNTNATSGYACIDQPGRGKGDLLQGFAPNLINSRTGTISWPNEALEPVYEWSDTYAGAPGYQNLVVDNYDSDVLAPNRDYYLYTASFNGTSGVGSGLLSARPTTCTPNVAYWATDTNTLYQCSSPNTWTKYYTPYPYPHPLVSGTPGPPQPGPNPPPPGPNPPPVTVSTSTLAVQVYPNPWRVDKHSGINITFSGLTTGTTIKLFTISGHKVKEVTTDGPSWSWDRTNDSGDPVASGIYIYLITDRQGDKVKGKVAVIK